LNSRVQLSLALIVVAAGVGAVVASGVGAERPSTAQVAGSAAPGAEAESPARSRLWNDRGCVTCHGADARGTPMGPDLTKIVPMYIAKHGSVDAAHRAVVAYLIDPRGSPKLRDDGVLYVNPMPPIEKLFGGRREDADALASMLLRLAR